MNSTDHFSSICRGEIQTERNAVISVQRILKSVHTKVKLLKVVKFSALLLTSC